MKNCKKKNLLKKKLRKMTEKSSSSGEQIVKIPDSFEMRPKRRRRSSISQKILNQFDQNQNQIRKSISIISKNQGQTIWEAMNEKMQANDDFFCLPQVHKNPENENESENSQKSHPKIPLKRRASFGVVLKPIPLDTAEFHLKNVDDEIPNEKLSSFFTFLPQEQENNQLATVISQGLESEMQSYLKSLQESIQETSDLLSLLQRETNKIMDLLFLNIYNNRIKAVLPAIKIHYLIKESKKKTHVFQGNIRRIAQVLDFIHSAHSSIDKFNYDLFSSKYIIKEPHFDTLKRIQAIDAKGRSMIWEQPKPTEWDKDYYIPSTRSYKILHRFLQKIDEMDYYDVEIIDNALIQNKNELFDCTRSLLFDKSWEILMFPFSDTPELHFPKSVFERTPKSFNVPFIPEPYSTMPLNILNSTDWPLRNVSENLFIILVETDPFVIADLFWTSIQEIGKVVKKLDPSVTDLDFDQLFTLMIAMVVAFGCDEILEVFHFSSSFEDYETKNAHRKFAMQHMQGLVQYLTHI